MSTVARKNIENENLPRRSFLPPPPPSTPPLFLHFRTKLVLLCLTVSFFVSLFSLARMSNFLPSFHLSTSSLAWMKDSYGCPFSELVDPDIVNLARLSHLNGVDWETLWEQGSI